MYIYIYIHCLIFVYMYSRLHTSVNGVLVNHNVFGLCSGIINTGRVCITHFQVTYVISKTS